MTDEPLVAAVRNAGIDVKTRDAAVACLEDLKETPHKLQHSHQQLAAAACSAEEFVHIEASQALYAIASVRPGTLTSVMDQLLDGLQRDSPCPALRATINELLTLDHDPVRLCEQMNTEDRATRRRIVQLLAYQSPIWIEEEARYGKILTAFAEALADSDDWLRYYGALGAFRSTRGLSRLFPYDTDLEEPDRRYVDPFAQALVEALADSRANVRRLVVQAVTAHYFALYEDGTEMKTDAVERYVSCLTDSDPGVRRVATMMATGGLLITIRKEGFAKRANRAFQELQDDSDPRVQERAEGLVIDS